MNIKSLKPYLHYVVDNELGKNKKFEFISLKGKIYNLLFYKLNELDPPFEVLCIIDTKNNYRHFYEISCGKIIWDNKISKQLKNYCDRVMGMFVFL
jgi:hypothetical protein